MMILEKSPSLDLTVGELRLELLKKDNLTLVLSDAYNKVYEKIFDGYLKTPINKKLLSYLINNGLSKSEKSPYDRVIFTEDNEAFTSIAKIYLEFEGFDVDFCANDIETFQLFKSIETNSRQSILLLMDYNLGNSQNGAQITREIRRLYENQLNLTIALFSTGESFQQDEEPLFDGLLRKPFKIDKIVDIIKNSLERFLIKSLKGQLISS